MGDIIKKVRDQVPEGLLGFEVFLAANMAKTPMSNGSTV